MCRLNLVPSFTILLELAFSNYYLTDRSSLDCRLETQRLITLKKGQKSLKKIFVQIFTRSITSWRLVKTRCEFLMRTLNGCKSFLPIPKSFLKMDLLKSWI